MTDHHLNALPKAYRLEEYELVRVLGSGGFGITYLGYDHNLDKGVAVKEYLPADIAARTGGHSVAPQTTEFQADFNWGLERFLDEARTLARFTHPNIIQVHRFFEAHGTAYIVMEYAEGETLAALLKRRGTLAEAELQAMLLPLLSGLAAVHEAGILHRDIKPGNIMLRAADGSPVLVDFGAARQAVGARSRSMTAIVTPGYAPIEQYSSRGRQGPWTDMYALGGVCYRALTGELPAEATDRVRSDPLIPITVAGRDKAKEEFLRAVDWALRLDEGDRPQEAGEWRAALLGEREAPAGGEARPRAPARKPATKTDKAPATERAGIRWSSVALTLVIVALLGASAWQGWRLYREMPDAGRDEAGTTAESQAGAPAGPRTGAPPDGQAEETAPDESPTAEQDEVTRLLAAAGADLAARRLTSPAGNNAWEKYQQVLRLSPANPEAMAGMERVIESYMALFGAALAREEFDEAEGYLAKIRELHPDSPMLGEGRQRLQAAKQARSERLAEQERQRQAEEAARRAELERQRVAQEIERHWQSFETALEQGEWDRAEDRLNRVRELDPDAPNLADSARRLSQAREAARKALEYAGEMVDNPAGSFRMGDISGAGDGDERPVHTVTLRPFKMGKYEVTFAQWDACVADGGCGGYRPGDEGWGRGNRPVMNVSWDDAEAFIDWLNSKTDGSYRLPTEAEWEYAARAGTTTKYHFGNDESQLCQYANHTDISTSFDWRNESCSDGMGDYATSAQVGRYQPNSYGLYDMHGNVWELTQDCWNDRYVGAPADGSAWMQGDCSLRVIRGGSWASGPGDLRSAKRSKSFRSNRYPDPTIGFRLAQGQLKRRQFTGYQHRKVRQDSLLPIPFFPFSGPARCAGLRIFQECCYDAPQVGRSFLMRKMVRSTWNGS